MPSKPARACSHRGCPNLVRDPNRRHCDTHQSEEWSRQKAERTSPTSYGARWNRISKRFLRVNPECRGCGGAAELVHHIIPRAEGGSDGAGNLVALCQPCHSTVHATRGDYFG